MQHTRRVEYSAFLQRLVEARRAAGMQQEEVAKKLRKTQSYVSKCESGARRMDIVEVIEFAKVYGVSLDVLGGMKHR